MPGAGRPFATVRASMQETPPRGRGRTDSERKAEILAAAASVFAASGLRASLQDVAAACGILPGSLYHHFESKQDLFIELVRRYQAELDGLARKALEPGAGPLLPEDRIVALGTAIAECAVRHRAALLLTLYEPPAGPSQELVRLANRTPAAINTAMLATLEAARSRRQLRREVDLELLADRICQAMLHGGIGVYHRSRGAERVPAIRCRMLLRGLAVRAPDDARLDRSRARRAADACIDSWGEDELARSHDEAARIRAVARSEFALRGYDLTKIRNIAAAAGMSIGAVYRAIGSKDALMASILLSYVEKVTEGWNRIAGSASTPLEKLDALLWFDVNVVHRFAEEHRIQSLGLQLAPPQSPNLTWTFPAQLRQLKDLISEGVRAGQLNVEPASLDRLARCLFALVWTPENIVQRAGRRGALRFARATLLRGAARR
jgi:AcrR family transcriptional regulator